MSSDLVSMNLNGTEYYYIRNAQGDIIGLIDGSGTQVVSYTYDSWGKLISIDGALKDSVGIKNPYRYRGYRYDTETALYYLNSRYYNPEFSRFINADRYLGFKELLSCNMFSYCKNNCVNMFDSNGFMPTWAKWALGAVAVIVIAAIAVVALPAEVVAGAVTVASAVVIRVAQAARNVGPTVARVVGKVSETLAKNASKGVTKSETTRVGRWMSQSEHDTMVSTGKVPESYTGTTHVANPATPEAFGKQAKPGTIYVEFDVPTSSLKPTNEGWSKIVGPNSLEGRLATKKGKPLPEMPSATKIEIKGRK